MGKTIRILFPCIGRRVALAEAFRAAARELKQPCEIIGTDTSPTSPALARCDQGHIVPPISHSRYESTMKRVVREASVDLVVPTIDLDLMVWAGLSEALLKSGCRVLVSSCEVVELSQDKRKMDRFLRRHGFQTPRTMSIATALKMKRPSYPYFLKPWDGHASRGSAVVRDKEALRFYGKRVPNCIVQEFVEGPEYTVDVLVDFDMNVRCVVPRERLETRAGEVSKARTVHHKGIIAEAKRLVETLGAGPGVVTIQCFLTPDGDITIIEVNPRFGGGIPLTIQAGARMPRWILQWLRGQHPRIEAEGWKSDLYMLRFDDAVWLEEADLQS